MIFLRFLFVGLLAAMVPTVVAAHVSEGGFVLLLPTGVYTVAGVAVVALTVAALFGLSEGVLRRLYAVRPLEARKPGRIRAGTSLLSFAAMLFVFWQGWYGPHQPLANLLPLSFWTIGWVAVVGLAGIVNLWPWLNPWTGLYRLLGRPGPLAHLPERLGMWPAVILLVAFAALLLADPAPDDPVRLATILSLYWVVSFAGLLIFGPGWLQRAELGHAICDTYGSLNILRRRDHAGLGWPGWQTTLRYDGPSVGIFALVLLGVGSFDGLNETFWWLARIGVNPLEFPGRSAVIGPTIAGLLAANVALVAVFALTVWLGLRLAVAEMPFDRAFGWLAVGMLPIALVYHLAHYLTSFMVSIQYVAIALNDPFRQGADLLGLGHAHVTTGFFNRIDTVRLIWLTQAGLVVGGHVWSVLLTHRIALVLVPDHRQAARLTLPLSLLMIAYTFLGLWLLAAAKGA